MKPFLITALAAGILATTATASEARRGTSGWVEQLQFVADTQIQGLSLCHLVKRRTVFFIPISTESLGYGLAENNCDTESYYPLSKEEMIAAQADGVIDAKLPSEPSLSTGQQLGNYLLYGLLGLGALAFVASKIGGRSGKRRKKVSPTLHKAMLNAMCAMANADGVADPREIEVIRSIYAQLTGAALDAKVVLDYLNEMAADPTGQQLATETASFSLEERHLIMKASLMVACADGEMQQQEHGVIMTHARALKVSGDDLRAMLSQLSPTPAE